MENIENNTPHAEQASEMPADPEAGKGFITRSFEKIKTALGEYMELPLIEKIKNISMNALAATCAYAGMKILKAQGLGDPNADFIFTALPAGLFGAAYLQQKLRRSEMRDMKLRRQSYTEGQ